MNLSRHVHFTKRARSFARPINQSHMMTSTRRTRRLCVALSLMFVLGHSAIFRAETPPRKRVNPPTTLRSTDARLLDMVEQGMVRSDTLRTLQARLQRSQVIVYVERATLPSGLAGRTRLMGVAAGWRYLSIELDARLARVDALTILGHELQHAVEIAEADSIIDDASMAALYRRIGIEDTTPQTAGLWFETREALDMGHRVHAELFGSGW